jgi:hypothetical protein
MLPFAWNSFLMSDKRSQQRKKLMLTFYEGQILPFFLTSIHLFLLKALWDLLKAVCLLSTTELSDLREGGAMLLNG